MQVARRTFTWVVLWGVVAHANAVDVSLTPRVLVGQGVPKVNLHIQERIAGFRLQLKRSDGKVIDVKGGGKPGQTRSIDLAQPEGKFEYVGELAVNLPDGSTSSMPLQFEAEIVGQLRLKFDKEKDADIAHRKVRFRLNRPAGKAVVKVLMDTGQLAMDGEVPFNADAPDTPLEITWPEASGRVMTINIQAYDTSGFFTGIELSPWQIDIPHEEVNFDTGKWDIRPVEQPKLNKSAELIKEAVAKFGSLAAIKLYVLGHTDTQGSHESNRTLSHNRARSIGSFLRRSGVSIPIFYEGFGEEAQLVQTPDETDEPRNRRAQYIISIEAPELRGAPFAPRWSKP